MDGADVGVIEQSYQISLGCLLESHDSRSLEPKVSLVVLCDLPNQPLEGKLADEKFGRLLVSPDVPKSDGPGPEAVRLLDTAGGRCNLPRSFGSEKLPGRLPSSRLASNLLSSCHGEVSTATHGDLVLMAVFIIATLVRVSVTGGATRLNC